jgi:hypothetical protein
MLGVRLGVVGVLAREDVKVLTVYVDLSVICIGLEVRVNNSGGFNTQIQDIESNNWPIIFDNYNNLSIIVSTSSRFSKY